DRDPFDVRAIADRRFTVIVPLVRHGHHALAEDALRVVLARLKFVTHHSHLGSQVLALDKAVDQAVSLELDAEFEILIGGGHSFVVVRTIHPSGAVEAIPSAVVAQGLRDIGKGWRALEHHVLEQVGHTGFTITLMTRTDEYGAIDSHHR